MSSINLNGSYILQFFFFFLLVSFWLDFKKDYVQRIDKTSYKLISQLFFFSFAADSRARPLSGNLGNLVLWWKDWASWRNWTNFLRFHVPENAPKSSPIWDLPFACRVAIKTCKILLSFCGFFGESLNLPQKNRILCGYVKTSLYTFHTFMASLRVQPASNKKITWKDEKWGIVAEKMVKR